ncbi:hypothetical protein CPB83DRAFT_172660 [Crepidotus variabilis]|uniref:Uncharacterized protein n=1 Tax=Crepidotus variabilis TaxID=179855 RepID=A0A9P6E3G1_9AGAR|nr:hypothetical protein CPB83DRAFT_172660 [Crepidotus variabilis]
MLIRLNLKRWVLVPCLVVKKGGFKMQRQNCRLPYLSPLTPHHAVPQQTDERGIR